MSTRALVLSLTLGACTRVVDLDPRSGALSDTKSLTLVFQRSDDPSMPLAYGSLGGATRDLRALGFGFEDGMSISPDGTRASYPTAGPDPSDFHQVAATLDHAEADDIVVLAHGTAPVLTTWSPDGTRLAFMDAATTSIAVVDVAAGATPTQLTTLPRPMQVTCAAPAWSPDGAQLAFATGTGVRGYSFVDHQTRELVPDGQAASTCAPRWSPDGGLLAYTADAGDGQGELLVGGCDGSAPHRVASLHGRSRPGAVRWSPDGAQLAYVDADGEGGFAIRIVDILGGAPVTLDRIASDIAFGPPAWSPDGTALLYTYFDDAAHTARLATIEVTGGPRRTLPLAVADLSFYAWLPVALPAAAP